jgi:hypothetical protein
MSMDNLRKVKVLKGDDFKEIPFDQLKKGDIFQLIEPTGELVLNEEGTVFNQAISEPVLIDGVLAVWSVSCKVVAKKNNDK